MDLHRGRPRGEDRKPASPRVAMAIDENIDPVVADHARDLGIGDFAHVAPAIERGANARRRNAAIPAVTVARNLEPAAIVSLEQPSHQAPGRMIAEVAG